MDEKKYSANDFVRVLEELKQFDYELWIRLSGYSHLSEAQWDWLIDYIKSDFSEIYKTYVCGNCM